MKKELGFLKELQSRNNQHYVFLPKKRLVYQFVNEMKEFLFPVCSNTSIEEKELSLNWDRLKLLLKEILIPLQDKIKNNIDDIIRDYFDQIPEIYYKLLDDAQAIHDFDPASYSVDEIIVSYPGFQAIMTYRLSHPLYVMDIPILPRLMSEYAHMQTGIDINPGATIGSSFFIDHGTGIVIGETTVIGNCVKIYQGVTIGALNVKKEEAKTKRHPTIEDNVIVYSGTTILGGNTVIGHDSVVGGNVWLTKSIEPYSVVHNLSEVKVRKFNIENPESINFII
jgi:serine O-acetyltransferase